MHNKKCRDHKYAHSIYVYYANSIYLNRLQFQLHFSILSQAEDLHREPLKLHGEAPRHWGFCTFNHQNAILNIVKNYIHMCIYIFMHCYWLCCCCC